MEEESINPIIVKGFNNGYILAEHEPELLDRVLKTENLTNDYIKALAAGKRQYHKEKVVEQIKKQTDQSKNQGLEK